MRADAKRPHFLFPIQAKEGLGWATGLSLFVSGAHFSYEMDDEKNHEQDEQDVDGEHGDVKGDETYEPSDEQDNGNCKPHVSLILKG